MKLAGYRISGVLQEIVLGVHGVEPYGIKQSHHPVMVLIMTETDV
jgi:hypothetical protein